jgi:hypothetical protein
MASPVEETAQKKRERRLEVLDVSDNRIIDDRLAFELELASQHRVRDQWQERIIMRMAEQVEKDLRAGGPVQLPSTEQQALALIKGVAQELEDAARALDIAAARFKNITGQVNAANETKRAAIKARKAAEGLIGE